MRTPNTTLQDFYQIVQPLRQREFSFDYTGMDLRSLTPVQIVQVRPELLMDRPEIKIRLQKELESFKKISLSCLPELKSTFEEDGDFFLIYPLLEGKSLAETLSQKTLSLNWNENLSLMARMCEELSKIHAAGLLYRNLSPQSFLMEKGEDPTLWLTDAGFYALNPWGYFFDRRIHSSCFDYLSPEQTGILRRGIDARSDIYSLGCIFYEMLTGTPPFIEKDIVKLFHRHLAQKPEHLVDKNPGIPQILDSLILKMLSKEPSDRFSSMQEVRQALWSLKQNTGLSLEDTSFSRERFSLQIKMAGREKEISRLQKLYHEPKEQTPFILIQGMSGLGKTKLMESFHEEILSEHPLFASFKPSPPLKNTPYAAIEEFLKQVLEQWMQPEDRTLCFSALAPQWERLATLFPGVLKFLNTHAKTEKKASSPKPEKKEILKHLAELIQWLGNHFRKKLIFFIDDGQWIDNESLEFFVFLSKNPESLQWLFLVVSLTEYQNFPPEILERLDQRPHLWERIILKPLEKQELPLLIQRILTTRRDLGKNFYDKIFELSMGIPLWVQEILKELHQEGILYQDAFHWKVDEERLSVFPFHPNLEKLILKRFQHFSQEDQEIISMASILGGRFYLKDLHEIFASAKGFEDLKRVMSALEKALQENFLEEELISGETAYHFPHEIMEKTLYHQIPEETRKELHLLCAEVLEAGKDLKDAVFAITYHYNRSGQKKKFVFYNFLAYEQTWNRYSIREASFYLKNVADFYLENQVYSPAMRDAAFQLAVILQTLGKIEDSFEYLKKLQEICVQENREECLIKIFLQYGTGYYYLNDTFTALSYYDQAMKLAEKKQQEITDSHPYALIGSLYYFQYDLPKAEHYLSLAAKYLDPRDLATVVRTYGVRSWTRVMAGEIGPCFEDVARIESLLTQVENPTIMAQIYHYCSICYAWGDRDFEKALRYANLAMDYAKKSGDLIYRYASYASRSIALGFLGQYEQGLALLEEGVEFSRQHKVSIGISILYSYEVNLLIWKKDFQGASDKAKFYLKEKDKIPEKIALLIFLKAQAILLFLEGKTDSCIEILDQGIDIYHHTKLLLVGLFFLYFKQHVLNSAGRIQEAKDIGKEVTLILQNKPDADFLLESAQRLITMIEESRKESRETEELSGTKEKIQLESIVRIGQGLSSFTEKKPLLQFVLEKSREATGAEKGILILEDRENQWSFETTGKTELTSQDKLILSKLAQTMKQYPRGETLPGVLAWQNEEINLWIHEQKIRSLLLAPLPSGNSTIGILYLESRLLENLFSEKDLEVLNVFTIQAAFFIQNQRLKESHDPEIKNMKQKTEKSGQEDLYSRYNITRREREIIKMVLQGLPNKEISQKIFVSLVTVKMHIHNIFEKTGVKNRVELVNLFSKHR